MDSPERRTEIDPDVLEQIDGICDEFEIQYKQGRPPEIEGFLQKTSELQQSTLLVELVKLDCHYRRMTGAAVSLRDYFARFPQFSESLELLTDEIEPTVSIRLPSRFELNRVLGEGTFGTVWKAWDTTLKRFVAIKIPKNRSMSAIDIKLIVNEAQAAAKLAIDGVVRILDFGEQSGQVYVVYEFVDGRTIKEEFSSHRPTERESVELCIKIARSLHQVHLAGIVHRDLKPSNILIGKDGQPQILDFGLAKRLDAESTIAQSGAIFGSLAYMSPEQARGRSSEVDRRSDIYSLGAILYELLTGQPVFSGTAEQVLNQILNQPPVNPRQLAPAIPRDLETVCLKALHKSANDRYQTAEVFAEDLQRFLDSEPIRGRRLSLIERFHRWIRKHPAKAICAMLLAGGFTAAGVTHAVRARQELARTHQLVTITSEPPGAQMVFIPLSPQDGRPEPARRIDAGTTPVTKWLPFGHYCVVAYTDQQTFHEVKRHVPDHVEDAKLAPTYRHQSWTKRGNLIELPLVKLWRQADIARGMAKIPGQTFSMGIGENDPELPSHDCRVADYLLDCREASIDDYESIYEMKWSSVPKCSPQPVRGNRAISCFSYDQAVNFAELAGKRLPTEAEYELVAARCRLANPFAPRSFGPAGEEQQDTVTIDATTRVFGLYSNVVEWTDSWYLPYPSRDGSFPIPEGSERWRTIRGGTLDHAYAQPDASDWQDGPRKRFAIEKKTWLPGLGFRCARSSHPRITEADFEVHSAAK